MPASAAKGTARISAAVLARNEQDNLPRMLRSLAGWVDEVVVVDGSSSDGTAEVARSFGATVLVRPATPVIDADRATAVAACTGDWILHVDADEVVPPGLAHKLRALVDSDTCDAIDVPETSWFLGEPCNVWAGSKVRLFRRSHLVVDAHIHDMLRATPGSRVARIEAAPGEELQHYWTDGVEALLRRTGRYTLIEAQQTPRAPPTASRMLRNAFGAFRTAYFKEGGRRNGWRGMYLSLHRALYVATLDAAGAEVALGGAAAIRAGYLAHADRLLVS
jgi:glycosyltransferase involved in cell wall biosynthesis